MLIKNYFNFSTSQVLNAAANINPIYICWADLRF